MAQYDINFREYWRILKKRKVLVTSVTIVFSIFITFFAYFKAPTPLYTTACLIEFERSPALKHLSRTYDPSAADDIETQITMVKSYPVFERVVETLGLVPQKDMKENGHLKDKVIATIENLQGKVEVIREGVSAILTIQVTDTNPIFAQKLANTIALAYGETHAIQQTRRNREQLKYIVSQLGDVRKKLRNAEDEVNRFAQENELVSVDLQSENLLAEAKDLRDLIRKLKEDRSAIEGVLSRLEAFIKNPFVSDHNFYSTEANKQYESTNDAMVGLILKRDTLLRSFTPKHPDVLAISDRIIENAKKMSFLLQTQIMSIQKKESDLDEELENVDKQTKVLMEKRLEFDRLKRKVDLHNEMTVLLERKNQEALIRKAEKPEIINIVKPALLPTQPTNSRNTVSAGVMSVVIGVVLGFVVAFIVETFDTSLGAIEDVEETLGTKVLGVIPQGDIQDIQEELMSKNPEKFKDYSFKHAFGIISHFLPKSMISESFRALRTNIQYKDPGKKARTLAITSSSPEEGKSMVASNLAITMAQGGMKTLLVGSDLRKPGIDKAFGVDRSPGLTDVLIGEHPWRDTVKTVTDIILGKMSWDEIMLTPGLDNLHIITSGTPPQNPAELIDSRRLEEFIEEVKEEYDVIIFDSSPILSTADAAILGMKVDGVLLVYRVGSISKGLLKRTASQLEQVQCNLMGVIINGMKPDISPDFQGYKYYTYYYSYGDGEDQKKSRLKRQQAKKPLLMIAAIACLSMGFLWQSGLIASFKQSIRGTPVKTVEVKTSTSELKVPTGRPVKPTQGLERPTKASVTPTNRLEESTQGLVKPNKVPEKSTKRLTVPTKKLVEPTKENITKMPMPRRPDKTAQDAKSTIPKTPKPGPISLKKEGYEKKSELNKTSSKASDSNALGNHGQGVAGSGLESMSPQTNKPEKKVPSEQTPPVMSPKAATPKNKASVEQAHAEQTLAEQTRADQGPLEKSSVEMAALFSGPSFGKASMSDLKKSEVREGSPKYPYTIQLGSFRKLVQAKNAVTLYREKGLSAFWSEVNLDGNERWFRVYTGLFETREQAKKYREEQNLLKSLVKRTPKNASVGTSADQQVPEGNTRLKMPNLMNSEGATADPKSSVPEAPKPVPIELKKEGDQKQIKLDKPNSTASSSNASGNHELEGEGSIHESIPPMAVTTEGKEILVMPPWVVTPEMKTPAEQRPAEQTSPKIPLPAVKPERKAPAVKTLEDVPAEQARKEQTPMEQALAGQTLAEQALAEQALAEQALAEQALAEQALAEQAQREKRPAEMASLLSGPFFGIASMSDLRRPETRKESPKYPYSIQLGSFRTLDRAKKAVASYRKKGLSAYWSQVGREGNEVWFRVYTGFFETREQANIYREEQNLLKSLVKRTPKNAFLNASTHQQVPEDKTLSKMPDPRNPRETSHDDKSPIPETTKPISVSFKNDGYQEKIRFDRLKSNASGSNPTGKHAPDMEPSMPKSLSHIAAATEEKDPFIMPQWADPTEDKAPAEQVHEEQTLREKPQKAVKSMGKVTVKIPPSTVKPEKKAPAVKPPAEQAHAEQAHAEQTPLEKPSSEMASLFSGPFFGTASSLDLKTPDSSEEYPKYPYSIQLGSFRTLDRAKKAVESYRKKGLHAYWSEADREGDERWFRVYTGSFESRAEARRYRKEQGLEISLVKKTPFSTFVGTYTDKQVLEDQTLLLSDLDYMPYAIREQDGKYRLFVGAFLTKKVAEEKQLDLESRGIQCQVIRR